MGPLLMIIVAVPADREAELAAELDLATGGAADVEVPVLEDAAGSPRARRLDTSR